MIEASYDEENTLKQQHFIEFYFGNFLFLSFRFLLFSW